MLLPRQGSSFGVKKQNDQVVQMFQKISISLFALFIVTGFAQDPAASNAAAPVIETYGVPEGAEQAPIAVPAPEPVAEPQVANQVAPAPLPNAAGAVPAAAPAADDGTLKNVGFDLSLGVYPISYNNQTLAPGVAGETGKWFLGIKPSAGLSTSFKTAGGRKVSFSAAYNFTLQEYYNKTQTKRDYTNEIDSNLKIEWSPVVSTSLPITFGYMVKQGADEAGDGGLSVDTYPGISFKLNNMISLDAKYNIYYYEGLVDIPLADANGGSDLGGSPITSDEYYDGAFDFTGQTGYGFTNQGQVAADGSMVTPASALHRIMLGTKVKAAETTSLGLTYAYQINNFGTDDNGEASGHYIAPSITQNLFKGNTIGLANEVRFLRFKYATVADGSAKQTFRNRLRLTVEQEITKNMKFDMFYRWQITASNADNYEKKTGTHWFYSGMVFSF